MALKTGDVVKLYSGYDYDPIYLKEPPASSRKGIVVKFIKGQNNKKAAVVKLDEPFSGEKITGDIVVLELRHEEQTWDDPSPVHIELCDFMPPDEEWKNRMQGEWVEAAAMIDIIEYP